MTTRSTTTPAVLIVATLLLCISWVGNFGTVHASSPVVARVDGRPITADDVRATLSEKRVLPTPPQADSLAKLAIVDSLVVETAIRIEAEKLDLTGDHQLMDMMRRTLLQAVMRAYVENEITPWLGVTADNVDQYWRDNQNQFTVQRTIVAPQLIEIREDLRDPGYREIPQRYRGYDAKAIIDDLYQRLKDGEDFDTLALYFSMDHYSRAGGGRIGWRYPNADPAKRTPWEDSLFSFPVGPVMPPFYSKGSWFIMRILNRSEPGDVVVPDTSMRRKISEKLSRERMDKWSQQFFDSVLAAGRLELFDSLLVAPPETLPPNVPIAVSNSTDTIYSNEYSANAIFLNTPEGSDKVTVEEKRKLVEDLHKYRSLWRAMDDLGYLDRPEFVRARKQYLIDAAMLRVRQRDRVPAYRPDPKEIREYYDTHPEEFGDARPLHVYQIILDNLDTALAVRERLDNGENFVALAQEYYRGDPVLSDVIYDLGFIGPDDMPPQIFAAANALKPGGISEPVQTHWGYHILQLVEKKKGLGFKRARRIIVDRMTAQHRREAERKWRRKLLAGHTVFIDTAAVNAIETSLVQPDNMP